MTIDAQPQIKFSETVHDFGTIKEDGGVAETYFEFTNIGNQALILNNVKTSCGCTTPEWNNQPIAPGQKGKIKVSYDPKNHPGVFSKNVEVIANTQPSTTKLLIKGKVEPREQTLAELYIKEMGGIRLKSNYVSLGRIYLNEEKTGEVEIVNTSSKSVRPGGIRIPAHIALNFEPEELKPGENGKILIRYDASKKNAYGVVNDRIYLTFNNESKSEYNISVAASIEEDFSLLTPEELALSPVASFDQTVFDFGNIQEGDKVGHEFKISNTGKTDLIIRNVKTSCGCTAVKHSNTVGPGETSILAVEFNSKGKKNRQNNSITVMTNDPSHSSIQLRVTGNVLAEIIN